MFSLGQRERGDIETAHWKNNALRERISSALDSQTNTKWQIQ